MSLPDRSTLIADWSVPVQSPAGLLPSSISVRLTGTADQPFFGLNTALMQDGFVLHLRPGVAVEAKMTRIPLGKAELRREGKGIAILAFGPMLEYALEAARSLDATVVNMRFVKPLDEDMVLEMAADHDLLVNATPAGMSESDPAPFSERQVRHAACVADIVADPPPTRLAALARRAGTTLVSGRDMVRGQIDPIAHWLLHHGLEQDDARWRRPAERTRAPRP